MSQHKLLLAQLRKSARADGSLDHDKLVGLIDASYHDCDRERRRSERSIDLMVKELGELNANLESIALRRADELRGVRIALDATLQNTAQGIFVIDASGRVTSCNDRAIEMLDLPRDMMEAHPHISEVKMFLRGRGEFEHVNLAEHPWLEGDSLTGAPLLYERRRPNGVMLEVRTVTLASGGAVRTLTDVTEERRRLEELRQAERMHRNLFENAAAGLYRATLSGQLLNANMALARIFGCENIEDFIASFNSRKRWKPIGEDWRPDFAKQLWSKGYVTDFVCEAFEVATGRRMWYSQTAWLVRDANGKPLYYEGSVADITARKVAENRLAHLAMHDSLTGLHNRAALMQWLSDQESNPTARSFAIHCIDLDRFKEVNDDLGHAAGDLLLRQAADRLTQNMRADDFAVRLGGDEFAVVQQSVTSPRAVSRFGDRLIALLSEEYDLDGCPATVGASVGGAIFDPGNPSHDQLLKHADLALYSAKTAGGGRTRLYDADLEAEHARRRMIEHNLKSALEEGQFSLAYQPILDCESGVVVNYEALIRWTHPTAGFISPAEFIPIAEQTAIINNIGEWVLREACALFARSRCKAGVSVNVSPAQLRNRGFVDIVRNTLTSEKLAPERLTLEITETALLSDNAATRAQLKELRAMGVKIALDDFGSGHSSLAYLNKYRFDKLKIDRSFIAGRRRNRVNAAVINAAISLGRDLGFEVIAEGVETEEQLKDLASLGCNSLQGYLIGRPQPAAMWPDLCEKRPQPRRVKKVA